MKIQVISDLHLEFLSPSRISELTKKIETCGEILVLAGDIGNGMASHYRVFIEKMSQKFQKIFLVAGNHEYYGNDVNKTNEKIRSVCADLENVSFLCSSWEDYMGFRWIGCTLWSHIDEHTKCFTNDTRCIQNMPISKYNERHSDAVEFLTNSLQQANDKKCVVITHYLPSIELINEKYRGKNEQPYNQWFASSLDNLIEKHTAKVPLWIYGHTHDPSMTTLFQTEMVCNPHGYEGENKDPDLNFIIDL